MKKLLQLLAIRHISKSLMYAPSEGGKVALDELYYEYAGIEVEDIDVEEMGFTANGKK